MIAHHSLIATYFVYSHGPHRDLHSFPTRRSSDLEDLLQQVLISSLAVAPDGSSVVYVRRTVEDGKYARRLWRVSFSGGAPEDRKSTRLNSSHVAISYAVLCLKKKKNCITTLTTS